MRCGTAGGAPIGTIAGNTALGAAGGGAADLAGGYLYGKHKEAEDEAYQRGYQHPFFFSNYHGLRHVPSALSREKLFSSLLHESFVRIWKGEP